MRREKISISNALLEEEMMQLIGQVCTTIGTFSMFISPNVPQAERVERLAATLTATPASD